MAGRQLPCMRTRDLCDVPGQKNKSYARLVVTSTFPSPFTILTHASPCEVWLSPNDVICVPASASIVYSLYSATLTDSNEPVGGCLSEWVNE